MLTLTEQAAVEIRNIVEQPGNPDTAGLRIADDATGTLSLSLVPTPGDDDLVVDSAGARIYLDQRAASVLDDKTLDAATDEDGRIQFGILDQGSAPT